MPEQENTRQEVITKVTEHINNKLPKEQAKVVAEFARQYYGTVSVSELKKRSILDLYGAVLSHWELIYQRKPGQTKIRIYNPHYEQHGWQSTHTIVEVVHDDMPFLVDSLRTEINRMGLNTHLMIHLGPLKVLRNEHDCITEILPFNTPVGDGVVAEAPISIEIDRQTDSKVLTALHDNLARVLQDVRYSVEDWSKMRGKLREALADIEHTKLPLDPDEIAETKDFLRWLENDHFTFLGYRRYSVVGKGEARALKIVPNSGLGVLRDSSSSKVYRTFSSLTPEARKQALSAHVLIISKTNTRSTVHRNAYTDYIGIKQFNDQGELIGEHRFIGLYTSTAYTSNPKYIPFVRRKVAMIMKNSNLSPTGHAGKVLLNILETLPRDDLFQANTLELTDLAMGILHLQERKQIRMFARMDLYHRFISCLVFVPRERFDTDLGYAMQEVLQKAFNALEISFTTWFSESVLARIHYVVRIDPKQPIEYDLKAIEDKLIEVGRSWKDDLKRNLLDYFGEEKGNALTQKYQNAFPAGYRETFSARTAIYDIEHMELLDEKTPLAMSFYRPLDEAMGTLHFKLFRRDNTIPLSDALPVFENMGLRVIGERPYQIHLADASKIWINDFSMIHTKDLALEIDILKRIFQDAFFHIWNGDAENDGFNKLVLGARLNWQEITLIRAYTKYLLQTKFTYSQTYVEGCLSKYPMIASLLVDLFLLRFDPKKKDIAEDVTNLEAKIQKELDKITLLDEDKILRSLHDVINATLRTNYYQKASAGGYKEYLSFKLDPKLVPDLPQPLPMYEIFVYSPRFEGIHLRSSKVARGGLRWSDRREDFRTEVLGLMKAQNVKNAVIVPSGAKGGFVAKNLPKNGSRELIMETVIHCYKNFIRGMLDITDNLIADKVVVPENVVRYDDDDYYLVVAADKGTATFSDIANQIAQERKFWLDDAFASGGSTGYDHKKMGITARGAWESVKRHFYELGHDIQNQDFTVIGIGDMAGDVFGNGMLLSRYIKLVGAFNHQHIFLDPDPDPETSFQERERLFRLPRSNWEDYDRNLISKGGGVYRRTAKAVKLSPEIKKFLEIKKDFIVPNELIKAMLKANVDLLWNGGIGTFVKSSKENHGDVGDRTNDGIRVDGNSLACRVAGEGGNLGFTQLGRVEYELSGGHIFTDFIDNSAGVDCSDHEVNIKILLNDIVADGDMTYKHRNALLSDMAEEVAQSVLHNNFHQTEALSLAAYQAYSHIDLHSRYIQKLARDGDIDRALEFLPEDQELIERKAMHKGLTRPELAILFAYCKSIVKNAIIDSDVPEDPYLSTTLEMAFPAPIRECYQVQMQKHRLRREIIANVVSNLLVNEMGFTFIYQLNYETGASIATIVRAYGITRNIFRSAQFWQKLEKLYNKISAEIELEIMSIVTRLVRRSTRWLLRNRRMHLDVNHLDENFTPNLKLLADNLGDFLTGDSKKHYKEKYAYFISANVPPDIASLVAGEHALYSALDIIEAANVYKFELKEVATAYFALSDILELGWLRDQIYSQSVDNQWEDLAKEAARDDLDWQQRGLTIAVLKGSTGLKTIEEKINTWLELHKAMVNRWNGMIANLRGSASRSFIMYTIAVRELMDLAQTRLRLTKEETNHKPQAKEEADSRNQKTDINRQHDLSLTSAKNTKVKVKSGSSSG